MRSLSLLMSDCSLSGRGQIHVSNTQLDRRRFVYDTYKYV